MSKQAEFIAGGMHKDVRGVLSYANNFQMDSIKRLYTIEHPNETIVRAWQGHKLEQKWFLAVKGSFKVVLVKPDNWEKPSMDLPYTEFLLDESRFGVLYIPPGLANGFQALEKESKLIVFSDFGLEESSSDSYRFENTLWYKW